LHIITSFLRLAAVYLDAAEPFAASSETLRFHLRRVPAL